MKPYLARLLLLLTAMLWGFSFVVMKDASDVLPVFLLLALRFSVAFVVLALVFFKKLQTVTRTDLLFSAAVALSIFLAYVFQTYGLTDTTPGKNAFLTATYCVLVPFLAWAVYKRKPGVNNVIAAVLCITGIGFVSLSSGFDRLNIGDVLTLLCGVFYAFQIIMMENYIDGGDSVSISAVEFSTAAVMCLAGALIFEPVPTNIPHDAYFAILYLSVMCTAVCFFLQAWGMQYTPSATAAVIMTLEAVFGALFSVLFAHEELTPRLTLGFSLIFVSVIMSEVGGMLFKRKKA